jgi:hypothetical protein
MKKLLLLATILLSINTYSQIPSHVPTSGLVGWYPFNGNANDASGNGNNGTVIGATLTTDRNSNSNSAYSFNGGTSYIQANLSSPLNTSLIGGLTLSGWINSVSYSQSSPQILASLFDSSNNGYGIGYGNSNGTNAFLHGTCGAPGVGASMIVSQSTSPITNTWYHVVMTCDFGSNSSKLYVNGSYQAQSTNTLTSAILNKVVIGKWWNSVWFQNGKLDDIGIWNRALNQSEILALYTGCNFTNVYIVPSGSTTFCQGNSVSLNANKANTTFTYTWFANGTPINGANSFTYNASQAGSYTLKIDSGGCSITSVPIIVTVNPLPNVSITSLPNTTNIKINSIGLSGSPSGGIFTGQGITGSIFSPSVANLGLKTITYIYTNVNGCSNSASTSTIVYDTVGCSAYIANLSLLQSDTTNKGITIRQLQTDSVKDQNSISFLMSDTTAKGVIIRQLQTDLANKHDTFYIASKITGDTLKISIHTGISSTSPVFNSLKVYPNPASTILNIVLEKTGYYTATMTGVTGQTIITPTSGTIDISDLANGIYTLTIMDSKGKTISVNKVSVLK